MAGQYQQQTIYHAHAPCPGIGQQAADLNRNSLRDYGVDAAKSPDSIHVFLKIFERNSGFYIVLFEFDQDQRVGDVKVGADEMLLDTLAPG
jgi:hypothetical protein